MKTARRKARNTPGPPIRAPQQKRSAATLQRILDAVTGLVEAGAYEQATVQEITTRAGCSVGAFYGRFEDKDAALYALYDARCARLEAATLPILEAGAAPEASLAATLRAFIRRIIAHIFENAALVRAEAFLTPHDASSPFWARAKLMNGRIHKRLEAVLAAHTDSFNHPHPERVGLIVLSLIGGLPRDAVKIGARIVDCSDVAMDAYAEEIERVVFGYLGVEPPEAP